MKVKHIEELFDICDYSEVQSHYGCLLSNYVKYLEENNISHYFTL